jgi:hypothetical protein
MQSAVSTRTVFEPMPPIQPDTWLQWLYAVCVRALKATFGERNHPWVLGIAGGLAAGVGLFLSERDAEDAIKSVLPTALSVVSIFAGFQSIALSIMIATLSSEIAQRLRKWGELTRVADYLKEAVLSVALFAFAGIVTLVAIYIGFCMPWLTRSEFALLVFLFLWTSLAALRLSMVMVKLFRYHLERLPD